jgi:hypothetical protein
MEWLSLTNILLLLIIGLFWYLVMIAERIEMGIINLDKTLFKANELSGERFREISKIEVNTRKY